VSTATSTHYWIISLVRAALALVIGLFIAFDPDHSPTVGFTAIGIFALLSGVAIAVAAARVAPSPFARLLLGAEAFVFDAGGLIAILLRDRSTTVLLILGTVIFALAGILELVNGLVSRPHSARREWIFVGAITSLLALVFLLTPDHFVQHFTGPDGVARSLTASVVVVGVFGAYAVIAGVYLAIAGLSQFWARKAPAPLKGVEG
jgi:uncharacterized membrane protein HdeD (DUF308 family)